MHPARCCLGASVVAAAAPTAHLTVAHLPWKGRCRPHRSILQSMRCSLRRHAQGRCQCVFPCSSTGNPGSTVPDCPPGLPRSMHHTAHMRRLKQSSYYSSVQACRRSLTARHELAACGCAAQGSARGPRPPAGASAIRRPANPGSAELPPPACLPMVRSEALQAQGVGQSHPPLGGPQLNEPKASRRHPAQPHCRAGRALASDLSPARDRTSGPARALQPLHQQVGSLSPRRAEPFCPL